MMKKLELVLLSFLLIISLSCRDDNKKTSEADKIEEKSPPSIIRFDFPDTVEVWKWNKGNLKYNTKLNDSICGPSDQRYIYFHIVINNDSTPIKLNEMKKMKDHYLYEDT